MMNLRFNMAVCMVLVACTLASAQGERELKIAADRRQFESKDDWLYNDLQQAYSQARETGKPIMAVLRCIPCEECVKLDDDLIDQDPAVASFMDKFILLRLTGTNGLDLTVFQYDTDQSFAIFFLNADRVVYGRFGTRSHRTEWVTDVSVDGLARAMEGALALHRQFPSNRNQLLAKSNQPTEFKTPEQFPTLSKKPSRLNWKGRDFAKGVTKNCIHCHEISEARLEVYWQKQQPIPEQLLYPYPHPKSVGLVLDPKHRARVVDAIENSPARAAGLKPGDNIVRMNGQPLISMADVQWVLHHVPAEGGNINLLIRRAGELSNISLTLEPGWRRKDDTSWRTGHWILRRSMLGGMKLAQATSDENDTQGSISRPALRVEYLGEWGPFGVAKRAGVQKEDIIVSLDGRTDFQRESDVFEYINENMKAGQYVQLRLLRNGSPVTARYQVK